MVGGPLIAIEVVSSEAAEKLDEKIDQYFAAGTKAVNGGGLSDNPFRGGRTSRKHPAPHGS